MFSGFVDLKQKLKHSLHNTWKNALVFDWIPEEKAKALSLSDYYVGLKWTKKKIALNNYKQNMNSILDLFDKPLHMKILHFFIGEKQKPMKIFIEGEWIACIWLHQHYSKSFHLCIFACNWLVMFASNFIRFRTTRTFNIDFCSHGDWVFFYFESENSSNSTH